MDVVCNKTECPMYGHFFDIKGCSLIEEMRLEKEDAREKALNASDSVIGLATQAFFAHVTTMDSEANRLRILCMSCKYYEKQDVSAYLIKSRALSLLKEK